VRVLLTHFISQISLKIAKFTQLQPNMQSREDSLIDTKSQKDKTTHMNKSMKRMVSFKLITGIFCALLLGAKEDVKAPSVIDSSGRNSPLGKPFDPLVRDSRVITEDLRRFSQISSTMKLSL